MLNIFRRSRRTSPDSPGLSRSEIETRLAEMAPWHFSMEVMPGVRTADFNRESYDNDDFNKVGVVDPHEMADLLRVILPGGGVMDRSFLDVGCNGGGYCFVARELGASMALGFDVREHWIRQAEFVKSIVCPGDPRVEFTVADVQKYEHRMKYDVTLFKGVFYHLPDPIHMLISLCELTERVMILDTATRNDIEERCMLPAFESKTHLMAGVDGLIWYPGGPAAVQPVFKYCGFPHTRVVSFGRGKPSGHRRGRFRMIAAREKGDLAEYDRWAEKKAETTDSRGTTVATDAVSIPADARS